MYEGVFLLVLTVLVILFMRPGKKVIYDNPVVIHQAGLYHATLAPALIRVQPLIEAVARLFFAAEAQQGDINTQYCKVSDGGGSYLLAAGFRAGTLYFQAIAADSAGRDYAAINQFSDGVLQNIPISADVGDPEPLLAALFVAAEALKMSCSTLNAGE